MCSWMKQSNILALPETWEKLDIKGPMNIIQKSEAVQLLTALFQNWLLLFFFSFQKKFIGKEIWVIQCF